ncbi:MAG: leucine dehydrogenase [Halieaceae bacterium]|jgi:leucine dehydrogenase
MTVFSAPAFDGHEQLSFCCDQDSGLNAIIAIHDTTLGPAVGGCRMFPYASDEAALDDVLRLSRGMTYKSALAGLPLGGGKSVIIGDPRRHKRPELLRAMARFIDGHAGRYVAAEDSGTTVDDLTLMANHTRHVSGIAQTEHGGDPSPSTARGVFVAIGAALAHRLGSADLHDARVAVQGLGHVGFALAAMLRDAGAQVFAADVNPENVQRAEDELGVCAVTPDEVLALDADILAPCAMGGVLNAASIPLLRTGIVAGAANNQLATSEDGGRLADRGILYCPDFLINAGGIVDIHYQRSIAGRSGLLAHIDTIAERLLEVLRRADSCHGPTQMIAEALARELIDAARAAPSPALRVA